MSLYDKYNMSDGLINVAGAQNFLEHNIRYEDELGVFHENLCWNNCKNRIIENL
jgi:hypothetical protein